MTFSISKDKQKAAKFIRLTQIGKTSSGTDHLVFQYIEFYGYLKYKTQA